MHYSPLCEIFIVPAIPEQYFGLDPHTLITFQNYNRSSMKRFIGLVLIATWASSFTAHSQGTGVSVKFAAGYASSTLQVAATATKLNGTSIPLSFSNPPEINKLWFVTLTSDTPVQIMDCHTLTVKLQGSTLVTGKPASGTQGNLYASVAVIDPETGTIIDKANNFTLSVKRLVTGHDTSTTQNLTFTLGHHHAKAVILRITAWSGLDQRELPDVHNTPYNKELDQFH